MKYIVIGGAGFIGSHVAEEVVNKGEEVVIIDNLFTGDLKNFEHIKDKVKFIKGDIRDKDMLMKELKGADFVILQAAMRSVPHSLLNPQEYNDVNINGTLNVLEASKKNNVKRVVFASSSSVYGDDERLPQKEGNEGKQISPYALTKLVGEKYLWMYWKLYGLETVSLRYFNVFGPRQDPDSEYSAVIPLFIKAIATDKKPTIFGTGEQTRDFTYISNVVDANLMACTAKGVAGEAFNIANGDQITVNKLWKDINKILEKNIEPEYTDVRAGDILHTRSDPSKAKKIMGFEGKVSFEEGLKKTVEWFLSTY